MNRSALLLAAAGAVVVVGLFGWDRIRVYIDQGRTAAIAAVEGDHSMETEIQILEDSLGELDRDVEKLREREAALEVDCERLAGRVEQKKRVLSDLKAQLAAAREILARGEEPVTVGGRSYSLDEIRTDAKAKVESCKLLQSEIAELEEALRLKREALAMARKNAQEARTQRAEFETKIRILRSQLDRIRTREEWQNLKDELLADQSAGAKLGEFRKKLDELTKQAEVRLRVLDQRAIEAGGATGRGIDYTRSEPAPSEDRLLGEIDALLGEGESESGEEPREEGGSSPTEAQGGS